MSDNEDWAAESARAMDDHDPSREPYASMSKDELAELLANHEGGAYEFEVINQHLLDKCTEKELERINFTNELMTWLMDRREVFGNAQIMLCNQVAIEAAGKLFGQMPPPGPLHEIN